MIQYIVFQSIPFCVLLLGLKLSFTQCQSMQFQNDDTVYHSYVKWRPTLPPTFYIFKEKNCFVMNKSVHHHTSYVLMIF